MVKKKIHYFNSPMKKHTIVTLAVAAAMSFPALAFAAESASSPAPTLLSVPTPVAESGETAIKVDPSERGIKRLKAQAARLIRDRVVALTRHKARIMAYRVLNDEQKNDLIAQVEENITKLTELGEEIKIFSGTVEELKEKVQSIYTDYRIYAVFIPKMQLSASLYVQSNHAANLDVFFTKAQQVLDVLKERGKDITELQSRLDDAKAQREQIAQKITDTQSVVNGMQPSDYPDTSNSEIKSSRSAIVAIHRMFVQLRWTLTPVKSK